MRVEANREKKPEVLPSQSQVRKPGKLRMAWDLERQKLRDNAFSRDENDQLHVTDGADRSASGRTKQTSTFCMANGYLFLVCTKQLREVPLISAPFFQPNIMVVCIIK